MRIVCFGDMHLPYVDHKALKEAIYITKQINPTHVVQIGDMYDFFSASRFPKKIKVAPDEEYLLGLEQARGFWNRDIKLSAPKAKKLMLRGNHDDRPYKRCEDKTPELLYFLEKGISDFFTFPDVEVPSDSKAEPKIHGITFNHGWLSNLGAHRDYYGSCVVVGHSHIGGVVHKQYHGRTIWELNCGYLGDETADPLKYNPTKSKKWTLGLGLIESRGKTAVPSFIPL
jgi:predicted phosphodiesterase